MTRKNVQRRYAAIVFAMLCLAILSGCGHTGIILVRAGHDSVKVDEGSDLLPPSVSEFTVSPGDVLRIEAAIYTAPDHKFLLERGGQILITFHAAREGDYRLMPGDEIRVSFLTDNSLDFDITIRLDGRISIPRIGEVEAAGKTPGELGKELSKAYQGKIEDPRTMILVLRSNMEPINLMAGEHTILPDGDVHLPLLGAFSAAGASIKDLEDRITRAVQEKFHNNLQASVVATNIASQQIEQYDRVITVTPSGGVILPKIGYITVSGLTLSEMKKEIQDALRLKYSNEVDVSLTFISGGKQSVYVGGEVIYPGVYPLAPAMTMLKALMAAGSAKGTADLSEAVLVHYDKNGDLFIYKTNLEEVMKKGKAFQDLPLSSQDIIFIPRSGIAEANLIIDQYISGMLPFGRSVNYNYNRNPDYNQ